MHGSIAHDRKSISTQRAYKGKKNKYQTEFNTDILRMFMDRVGFDFFKSIIQSNKKK